MSYNSATLPQSHLARYSLARFWFQNTVYSAVTFHGKGFTNTSIVYYCRNLWDCISKLLFEYNFYELTDLPSAMQLNYAAFLLTPDCFDFLARCWKKRTKAFSRKLNNVIFFGKNLRCFSKKCCFCISLSLSPSLCLSLSLSLSLSHS